MDLRQDAMNVLETKVGDVVNCTSYRDGSKFDYSFIYGNHLSYMVAMIVGQTDKRYAPSSHAVRYPILKTETGEGHF